MEGAWLRLDGRGIRFRPFPRFAPRVPRILLDSGEVAALLPTPDFAAVSAPPRVDPTPGLPIGRVASGGVVNVPVEPDQGRHLAVLGETGMGKSSLLVALAVRAARRGGLVVLDPLGETVDAIARELASERGRVLTISPGAAARSLNAVGGIGATGPSDPVRSERRLTDLVHALRRVRSGRYADSAYWGPRLEEMLTRAVRAAAALPGGTLSDAHAMLSGHGFTRHGVPPEAEVPLRELAARMRERPDDADGARRLLHEVVRDPTLSRMLCARAPDLTPGELVAPGRIVLISGEAARVGEATARYLLAVYLALLWSELLAAPACDKRFVLLDEAQWFAHEGLSEMLRLARRRNVHVFLATQSVASLPESVGEAVWTNVADLVAFRGLPDEARQISRGIVHTPVERLESLSRGEALVLIGKGSEVHVVRTARRPRPQVPPDAASGAGSPEPAVVGPGRTDVEGPEGRPAPPSPARHRPTEWAEVADWLRGRAAVSGAHGLFGVPLDEIRERFPDDPEIVRRLGSFLGRTGVLRTIDRRAFGPLWWIDREALETLAAQEARRVSGDSARPQPS